MRRKTVLTIALLVTFFAGWGLFRYYVNDGKQRRLEAARQAAKSAATIAASRQLLRGEWIGENRTIAFSADDTYRESHATRLGGTESGISYSYDFSYVLSGRWRVDAKGLTQEVTDVNDVMVTAIEASSDRVSEQERVAFLQNFQRDLPGNISQRLKEMVGQTFFTEVSFAHDTLTLRSSTDSRRYSRVR